MNILELLKHTAEAIDAAGRAATGFVEDHVEIRVSGEDWVRHIAGVTHDGDRLVLEVE